MTRGRQVTFAGTAIFFGWGFIDLLAKEQFSLFALILGAATVIALALDQRLRGAVAARRSA